ncbi:MAG: hypothetical protein V2A79_09745 [Planctomycetota bacterium]
MPANLVKTPADERAWSEAKRKLGGRYGKGRRHWATLVRLFQRIKGARKRKGQ